MLVQVGFEGKSLFASGALEVLRRRMSLHVSTQVGAVGKAFFAHSARVWLLARVGSEMTLEQPRSGEGLPTHIALVTQVVCQDVHGEGRHGDVHLAADVALLSIVGIQASMSLLVPGEVRAGGVILATFGTHILGFTLVLLPFPRLLSPPISYRQRRRRRGRRGVGLHRR